MSPQLQSGVAERERILAAVTHEVGEKGYRETALSKVLIQARVDAAAFHRHFEDLHAAFLAAWGVANESFVALVLPAFQAETEWRWQMRALATAIFEFVVSDPHRARILFIEGRDPNQPVQAQAEDPNVEVLVAMIDAGRQQLAEPEGLTKATAEGIFGAVKEQITLHLLQREDNQLDQVFPLLMARVVCPYLGDEVAAEELEGGAPMLEGGGPGRSDNSVPG